MVWCTSSSIILEPMWSRHTGLQYSAQLHDTGISTQYYILIYINHREKKGKPTNQPLVILAVHEDPSFGHTQSVLVPRFSLFARSDKLWRATLPGGATMLKHYMFNIRVWGLRHTAKQAAATCYYTTPNSLFKILMHHFLKWGLKR